MEFSVSQDEFFQHHKSTLFFSFFPFSFFFLLESQTKVTKGDGTSCSERKEERCHRTVNLSSREARVILPSSPEDRPLRKPLLLSSLPSHGIRCPSSQQQDTRLMWRAKGQEEPHVWKRWAPGVGQCSREIVLTLVNGGEDLFEDYFRRSEVELNSEHTRTKWKLMARRQWRSEWKMTTRNLVRYWGWGAWQDSKSGQFSENWLSRIRC